MGKEKRVRHEPMPTLRAWRESLKMSRPFVAGEIDRLRPAKTPTDQATIAKWESGETAVRVEDLKLLAQIYGTTPDRLFFDPGDDMMPALMKQAHDILTTKDPEAVQAWVQSGKWLPGRPTEPDKGKDK